MLDASPRRLPYPLGDLPNRGTPCTRWTTQSSFASRTARSRCATIGTSRARVRVQTWLDLLADVGFVPYPAADPWEAPVFLGKRPDRSRMSRAP